MVPLDLRVRAFGWVQRQLPGMNIQTMTAADIARAHDRGLGHNGLLDAVFGGVASGVALTNLTMPGPEEDLPVRIYRPMRPPAEPRPLIVNFHGGGWTLGNLDLSDWLCSHVAKVVGAVVVSVDYRLAPKDRFPAAVDDCYAALEWAAGNAASLGADPRRLAVMGDSAGGNLAAVVCLLARDHAGPAIAHQALLYPCTDLVLDSPSMTRNKDEPILSRGDMVAFRGHYLGPDADASDWRVSPLRADDHAGLPPALIQVADHDVLHDDGVRYAGALAAAGVAVRLTEYVGTPHGYLTLPGICRAATQALAELTTEQARALTAETAESLETAESAETAETPGDVASEDVASGDERGR
jgi:acetyl esterase/lipase